MGKPSRTGSLGPLESMTPSFSNPTRILRAGPLGLLQNAGRFSTRDFSPKKKVWKQPPNSLRGASSGNQQISQNLNPILHRIQIKKLRHELRLINRGRQKEMTEVSQTFVRQVAASIQVSLASQISGSKGGHIVVALARQSRETIHRRWPATSVWIM